MQFAVPVVVQHQEEGACPSGLGNRRKCQSIGPVFGGNSLTHGQLTLFGGLAWQYQVKGMGKRGGITGLALQAHAQHVGLVGQFSYLDDGVLALGNFVFGAGIGAVAGLANGCG